MYIGLYTKLLLICTLGKKACIIAIPSNGGIGMRLKKASETFTMIIVKIPFASSGERIPCAKRNLNTPPATTAIKRLVRIPAEATKASPILVLIL
jgi:hypothetical protein